MPTLPWIRQKHLPCCFNADDPLACQIQLLFDTFHLLTTETSFIRLIASCLAFKTAPLVTCASRWVFCSIRLFYLSCSLNWILRLVIRSTSTKTESLSGYTARHSESKSRKCHQRYLLMASDAVITPSI